MKTKAAVVYEPGKRIEIEELDLDGPREGEVLIRYTHAGLCHSDVHIAHGDLPARLPMVLGHEGAGIIEEVGPGVTRVKPGDHVVLSFIPNCGVCRYCATGRDNRAEQAGDTDRHRVGSIMTLFRKTVKGSLFGDCNPTTDIPKILGLYQAGDLKLDEIITRTYTLDEVDEGYDDLLAGKNVRGVIVHEH